MTERALQIYEMKLQLTDEQQIFMPAESRVLSVNARDNNIHVYFTGDTSADTQGNTFFIYLAGMRVPEGAGNYIGSVELKEKVWHIFRKSWKAEDAPQLIQKEKDKKTDEILKLRGLKK